MSVMVLSILKFFLQREQRRRSEPFSCVLVLQSLRACKSGLWLEVGGLPLWAAGPGELALQGPPLVEP